MEIPEYVLKKLEEIAERNELDLEEVKKEYEKKYNSDFVQNDPQFEDDKMRHRYASGAFWNDYMSKPKVTPTTLIPIGVTPIGKSKGSSLPYCSMFFLDKSKKLRRCAFNGNVAFDTKDISYWNLYKDVKLMHFQSSNDYGADDRAEFEDPQILEDFDKKSIISTLKIPQIKLSEVSKNESKKDSAGYTDPLDWKCVRGFISYESKTSYEDGDYGEWGRYSISSGGEESMVSEDGTVNTAGFSLTVSPTLMDYPKDSECYFLGTIRSFESKKTKETVWTMDCHCIIPIIVVKE